MGKRTGKPMGRPPKPPGQKYVNRLVTFPPDLWARFEAAVPEGDRSAVIQELVRRELDAGALPAGQKADES